MNILNQVLNLLVNKFIMLATDIWFVIIQYIDYKEIDTIIQISKEINKESIWSQILWRDLHIKGNIKSKKDYESYLFLCENIIDINQNIYDFCNKLFNSNFKFITLESLKCLYNINKLVPHNDLFSNLNIEDELINTLYLKSLFYNNPVIDLIDNLSYQWMEEYEELFDKDIRDSILYSTAYYFYNDSGYPTLIKLNHNIEKWNYSFITWYETLRYTNQEINKINLTIYDDIVNELTYNIFLQ